MKFSLFDIMHWPGGTNPTDFDPQRAAEVYDSRMQEYMFATQVIPKLRELEQTPEGKAA